MLPTIGWTRCDLRLNDYYARQAALAQVEPVIPVFVLEPALLTAPDVGNKRVAFLLGGLPALDVNLRGRGSRLIVQHSGRGDGPLLPRHERGPDCHAFPDLR